VEPRLYSPVSGQPLIVKDWTRSREDARDYVTVMMICFCR